MVADPATFPSLSVENARIVGATALVVIHVLDVLANADDVPGNSPREWVVRLSQWRSLWYWKRENRERAKADDEWNIWLAPFQLLPMTGAIVPFMLAALIGHFFHPFEQPPFDLGWWGLVGVVLLGCTISVATWFMGGCCKSKVDRPRGESLVAWIAAAGLIAGLILWPVK